MTGSMPQPAPDVLALVQACSTQLRHADTSELRRAFAPPAGGSSEGEPTMEQLDSVYATACALCDEGNFRFASALALHLATYKPDEPRFSFLAGTCMQRLGVYTNAARFYCFALIHGGDNPAALYRLGECLLATGDKVNAERALEASLDVARNVEGAREVQMLSQGLMETIKVGARARHHGN